MKRLAALTLVVVAALIASACKKIDDSPKAAVTKPTPTPNAGGSVPVVAGSTAVATPPATPGAKASDAEFEAVMTKGLAMFAALGKALDEGGDDCAKSAAGIDRVLTENQSFIQDAKKFGSDMDEKASEWMSGHKTEVTSSMMKMMTASKKCETNPQFAAAMKKLDSAME